MTEPVLRSKRQIFRLEASNSNGKIAKSNVRDNLQKMLKEVDALSDLSILCWNLPDAGHLGYGRGVEGGGRREWTRIPPNFFQENNFNSRRLHFVGKDTHGPPYSNGSSTHYM